MNNNSKSKLINLNETVPEKFYIFTNMKNPITFHNVSITKTLTSGSIGEIMASEELTQKYLGGAIDYIPFVPNQSIDIHAVSVYQFLSTSGYRIEYNCELYRKNHKSTKLYPSRFSCIYAFGDYESCKMVSKKYNWPIESVKQYQLRRLPLTRVAKVNMEVISLLRGVDIISSLSQEEQEKIWKHYWSGEADLSLEIPSFNNNKNQQKSSGVIWEYLIEGQLKLFEI